MKNEFTNRLAAHEMVAAYQAARVVRDLGGSPAKPAATTATPTNAPAQ